MMIIIKKTRTIILFIISFGIIITNFFSIGETYEILDDFLIKKNSSGFFSAIFILPITLSSNLSLIPALDFLIKKAKGVQKEDSFILFLCLIPEILVLGFMYLLVVNRDK